MNEHEEKFITSFILKEKRNRWQTQLDDIQKRAAFINRLDHLHDLNEKYVTWLKRNVDIEQMLTYAGSPDQVYILSASQRIDGRLLQLTDAIDQTIRFGWGTVISCIPGRLAFYYDECGERRAILVRKPNT